ncbi:MAG: formyltransferase family protein [bacterium]|nr:formyltransferase family protein [bacterium]
MPMEAMRVCAIASGGGSTTGSIYKAVKSRQLRGVKLALIISTSPTAGVLELMRKAKFPEEDLLVLPKGWSKDSPMMAEFILDACTERDIDFVGLYGALSLIPKEVVEAFKGKMVNQHPGPIDPAAPPDYDFGGQKMHGKRVHAARIEFVRRTGRDPVTWLIAHEVAAELDRGAVVHDRCIEIKPTILATKKLKDAAAAFNEIALPTEHEVQIETLDRYRRGNVRPILRPAHWLVKPGEKETLDECKQLAIEAYPD